MAIQCHSLKPFFLFFLILFTMLNLSSPSPTTSSSPSSNQEIDAIIQSLLCPSTYDDSSLLLCQNSDFTIWAKLLEASKTVLILPTNATMFVPTDAAISHLRYAADMDPYLIPYHITPQHHLLFSQLYQIKPLSLLPTLVPSKQILITSTVQSGYKVDNAVITRPDIYVSSRVVVHGINRILDIHPQRSSMPPLLFAGNVLAPTMSQASPVAAPAAA